MSNSITSADLAPVYQAFSELEPHMDDVRRLEDLEVTDKPLYDKLNPKILPLVQNTLNKLEDVLQKRGFFTEEFNTQVSQVKNLSVRINATHNELIGIIQDVKKLAIDVGVKRNLPSLVQMGLSLESPQMPPKLEYRLNTASKHLHSWRVTWAYTDESHLGSPSEAEKKINKTIAATFDRLVLAASRNEDKELIQSMEAFSNAYQKCVPGIIKNNKWVLEGLLKRKPNFIKLRQNFRIKAGLAQN